MLVTPKTIDLLRVNDIWELQIESSSSFDLFFTQNHMKLSCGFRNCACAYSKSVHEDTSIQVWQTQLISIQNFSSQPIFILGYNIPLIIRGRECLCVSVFEKTSLRVWEFVGIPVEKNRICWLGMFWSMAAGLSWFMLVLSWSWAGLSCSWAGASCLGPALDQLKPAQTSCYASKQLTSICCVFFLTGMSFFFSHALHQSSFLSN